jgi:hypothetical protein
MDFSLAQNWGDIHYGVLALPGLDPGIERTIDSDIRRILQQFPVDLIHSVVMRGLDPRIHHLCKIYAKKMDPQVKPRG